MTPEDAIERLPHRGLARWITRVVDSGDDTLVCEGVIPAESPFVEGGRGPAFLGIELAAQATAVLEISSPGADAEGGVGFLVRVRGVRCDSADLPAGRALVVTVRRTARSLPLAMYDVRVLAEGVERLRGSLSTFVGGG